MPKRNWRIKQLFPQEWSDRTRIAAELIENNWSIIEFGAGNGVLGSFIAAEHIYLPTDLVKRRDEFEIVDLDFPLNLNRVFDVGISLGVLEYVNNVHFSLEELSRSVPNFIMTYCCAKYKFMRFKVLRKYIGWENHLTLTEFEKILGEARFIISYKEIIEKRFFYHQYIYKLKSINV